MADHLTGNWISLRNFIRLSGGLTDEELRPCCVFLLLLGGSHLSRLCCLLHGWRCAGHWRIARNQAGNQRGLSFGSNLHQHLFLCVIIIANLEGKKADFHHLIPVASDIIFMACFES